MGGSRNLGKIVGAVLAPATSGVSLAIGSAYDYSKKKAVSKERKAWSSTESQRSAEALGLPTGGSEESARKNISHLQSQMTALGIGEYEDPYKKKTVLGG